MVRTGCFSLLQPRFKLGRGMEILQTAQHDLKQRRGLEILFCDWKRFKKPIMKDLLIKPFNWGTR